jgi:hypothetical protein
MIFCANKCAISGLCTSASALRVEHDPAIFLIVVSVIASEAKQSIARQGKYGLLRFAGNDGQISAGSPAMTDFSIRTMRPDEISLAVDWAAAEGWNPGHADDVCFASVDPEGFLIAELDGAPAATVSCVNYDASFAFLGFYGLRIWNAAIAHAGARVVGLDGVTAQQDNYKKSGFQLAYANVRYGGAVAAPAAPRADVIALSNVPFAAVEADDATVFPAPRSAFLRTWIGAPGHVGCALMRDGRLAGWGVIRPCRKGFKIGPLVADDRGTAEAVLSALIAKVGGGEIFLDVPDINREAIALAEDFGLAPVFETARMYTGAIPPLRLQRVFGVTSFELG